MFLGFLEEKGPDLERATDSWQREKKGARGRETHGLDAHERTNKGLEHRVRKQ